MQKVLVSVTIRKGRKVKKQVNAPIGPLMAIVKDLGHDTDKVRATLKEGKTYRYKHLGDGITLTPLVGHIDEY